MSGQRDACLPSDCVARPSESAAEASARYSDPYLTLTALYRVSMGVAVSERGDASSGAIRVRTWQNQGT